ncbi:hypothetical protein [Nitrospira sp. M1]
MSATLNRRQIWRMPSMLALVSTIGLLSALLGDAWWDVLSWGTLGYTVIILLWHISKSHG